MNVMPQQIEQKLIDAFDANELIGYVELEKEDIDYIKSEFWNYYVRAAKERDEDIHKVTCVMLVCLAQQSYNANLWRNLTEALSIDKWNTYKQTKLIDFFYSVMAHYNKPLLSRSKSSNCILAHGFVAANYIKPYTQFIYSYYVKDLNADLSKYTDAASDELYNCIVSPGEANRTKMLQEYTIDACRMCRTEAMKIIKASLEIVDRYYWQEISTTGGHGRYIEQVMYGTLRGIAIDRASKRRDYTKRQHGITKYHSPYIELSNKGEFNLVLPAQECGDTEVGFRYKTSCQNGFIFPNTVVDLGKIKTAIKRIPLNDDEVIERITVELSADGKNIRYYEFPGGPRFFNESGKSIKTDRIPVGTMIVITHRDILVENADSTYYTENLCCSKITLSPNQDIVLSNGIRIIAGKQYSRLLGTPVKGVRGLDGCEVFSSIPDFLLVYKESKRNNLRLQSNNGEIVLNGDEPKINLGGNIVSILSGRDVVDDGDSGEYFLGAGDNLAGYIDLIENPSLYDNSGSSVLQFLYISGFSYSFDEPKTIVDDEYTIHINQGETYTFKTDEYKEAMRKTDFKGFKIGSYRVDTTYGYVGYHGLIFDPPVFRYQLVSVHTPFADDGWQIEPIKEMHLADKSLQLFGLCNEDSIDLILKTDNGKEFSQSFYCSVDKIIRCNLNNYFTWIDEAKEKADLYVRLPDIKNDLFLATAYK